MKNDALLVERLLRRRRGPVPGMRSMMIVCGGAMRGTYGAGVVLALHQLGLGKAFDTVIGISTGAPTSAYFLSGPVHTKLATSVYYDDCPRAFLRLSRLHRPLDFNALSDIFNAGPKAIGFQNVKRSPSEFFALATRTASGSADLINVKTARPGPLAAIRASIAIPTLSAPVRVNGVEYIDGDIHPLPAELIIRKFHPTDVLIVPNRQEQSLNHWKSTLSDIGLGITTLRHRKTDLTRVAVQRTKRMAAGIRVFTDAPNINVGIIWPPSRQRINLFTRDSRELKVACRYAAKGTFKMFGRPDMVPEL